MPRVRLRTLAYVRRGLGSIAALLAIVAMAMAGLLAAPAANAAKDPVAKKFEVYLSFSDWDTYEAGSRDGVGDLSVFTGPVSTTLSGSKAGNYLITTRVIEREGSGRRAIDTRDTRIEVSVGGGTVLAQAATEDPTGKPPTGLHILPVVGGTGAYASARGTLIIAALGSTGKYRLGYDVFVDQSWSQEKVRMPSPSISVVGSDDTTASWQSAVPGDVIVTTREQGTQRLVIASTVLERDRDQVTYAHEVLLTDPDRHVLARGETTQQIEEIPGQAKTRFAILGATGDRVSQRGELRVVPSKNDGVRLVLRWGAQAGGKESRKSWVDDVKTGSVVGFDGRGGEIDGVSGDMRNKLRKGRDIGDMDQLAQVFPDTGWWVASSEQTFSEGTMMLAGFGPSQAEGRTWIVIGGTGNFGGASGTATGIVRSGTWKTKATYRR